MSNGTTTGNLRDITQGLGGTVSWDRTTRTATTIINGRTTSYILNKVRNGVGYASDGTRFTVRNGHIQVGVRQTSERAGAKVKWSPSSTGGVTVNADYTHASVSRTTKIKKDNNEPGELWTSDDIIIFEQKGNRSHVRYPVGNGYDTAWVDSSKLNLDKTPTTIIAPKIDYNKPKDLTTELEETSQINLNNDSFILPIDASLYDDVTMSSFFGYRKFPAKSTTGHSGWDFASKDTGKVNIISMGIGKIVEVNDNLDDYYYGRNVIVSYAYEEKTFYARYAHLKKGSINSELEKGSIIKQGDTIGVMGRSYGNSETGVPLHLHISTYDDDSFKSKDAFDMFSGLNLKGKSSKFAEGIFGLDGEKVTQQWFVEQGFVEDKYQPSFKRAKAKNEKYGLYDYDKFFGN